MRLTLAELAALVGGTLSGDGRRVVTGAAGLEEAGPEDVSFLADAKRAAELAKTRAGVVIVPAGVASDGGNRVAVKGHPQIAFAKVLALIERERRPLPEGIHPAAIIDPKAELAAGVAVGACAVIEAGAKLGPRSVVYAQAYVGAGAVIGADCILYPQVVVRERCVLGDRVILHPGAVIGGDGYGFVQEGGVHHKIPQIGRVVIEDDVEIGANSCVDRAALGETRVGAGTKVDNLVQIAHNVRLGRGCLIVSQVGIAGSSTLGNYVVLAGQAGVGDHITVGDEVVGLGRAGITKDIPAKTVVNGVPARPVREHLKLQALTNKLPELFEDVKELKGKLKAQS